MKGCKITCQGNDNQLIIGDFSRLIGCKVYIHGSHNRIRIGDRCWCDRTDFYIEDDNNIIEIANHSAINATVHFAAIEGTEILVGTECLFSGNIDIRTGDSHTIMDLGTKKRINPSESVSIGNHVWVGTGVTMLKGSIIPDNCIVGARSLVTKRYETTNCVIAGSPAKEVKCGIDWQAQRI